MTDLRERAGRERRERAQKLGNQRAEILHSIRLRYKYDDGDR
jgi:hypothetical protein